MKKAVKKIASADKKTIIKLVTLAVIVILMVIVTIKLMPWIISLKDAEGREALKDYINSRGVYGVFILLGIQVMQVVIAIIPGEPIEIVSGLLYGTVNGCLIALAGMLIGTVLIYYGVKFLGSGFVDNFINRDKFEKFKFLHDEKKLETVTFLLFFIPGTPKDILTCFMPFTKIKPLSFFIIVTIARIPSIISSTFAGESIGNGEWVKSLIIFAITGAVGLLGIAFNNVFIEKRNKAREKIKNKFSHNGD